MFEMIYLESKGALVSHIKGAFHGSDVVINY